jgi:hypothetical protein
MATKAHCTTADLLTLIQAKEAEIASLQKHITAPKCCPCGQPADVFDHDRPWVVSCARCWLQSNDR